MQIHRMSLRPKPYGQIAEGTKTFELRLYDEKRQQINVGDRIVFTNTEDAGQSLTAQVLALHLFESFADLYSSLPLTRCGYAPNEAETASPNDMTQYYSLEQQAQYGVVGIEIRVLR